MLLSRRLKPSAICLSFLLLTLLASPLFAARVSGTDGKAPKTAAPKAVKEKKFSSERSVNMDHKDVDIHFFIKTISELTGKNFIVDKRVKGKVTIISPSMISVDEAYKVFESVLEVNGFTVVEAGEVSKIIASPDARSQDVETVLSTKPMPREDKVITQIIPLSYASPNDIKKIFQPLIAKSSVMVSYEPANTLIITGFQSNIQRLLRILSVIDVEGTGAEISVILLDNAVATDMVKTVSSLFQKRASRGSKSRGQASAARVVADERTNSLIVLASVDESEKIKELINRLDREVPRGQGKIRVYYLQNATAEEVAKVLEKIATPKKANIKKGEAPLISKNVKISADKATNSLIITAEQDDYLILEDVIRKLDIPRSMVYIEALIMEVAVNKDFELGVEWKAGTDVEIEGGQAGVFSGSGGGGTDGAYSFFPSPTLVGESVALNFPSAFSLGIMGEALTIGDVVFPNIGAVLRAYKNDGDVHILSAPQLLTTNNQEAEIVVGKNVPYAVKQETSTTSLDYTTYEYRDVGVTLKITPQISPQDRLVRLNVFQEVKRIIEKESSADRPTTYTRSANTTVIVKDGNTIVIGGLIDQSTEGGSYKVPCLGDLPLLGYLFKSVFEKREQTNLYVFLTPYIVETPSDANKIFQEKHKEIRQIEEEAIKLYKRRGDLGLSFDALTIDDPLIMEEPTEEPHDDSGEPQKGAE